MALIRDHDIYDALPIPNDALDKGGVELLRAGVVEEELFVTARRVFADPEHWGYALADVARRLASLYAAEGDFTEANVTAVIAGAFAKSLAKSLAKSRPTPEAGAARKPAKRQTAKSARSRIKARAKAKMSSKSVARPKSARAKS
jgi:hypothetical protein